MKKIISLAIMFGILLFAGVSYGMEPTTKFNDPTNDPDSMVNYLDQVNAPEAAVPGHRGLMGLTESGLAGAAAGGIGENPDSMQFFLDPWNAPSERIPAGQTRIVPDNPDSIIYFLSPAGNN